MKKTRFRGLTVLVGVVLGVGLVLYGAAEGQAQQKTKVSYSWKAAEAKYTKQYSIDVSPDHQIRIFELHRTFSKDAAVFEGVKVKEEWMSGGSDYVDSNGRWWGYGRYIMENGDKVFYRADGISQARTNPDGTKTSTATAVKHLDGGTGKFTAIRGTLRHKSIFNPLTGLNEGQNEGEYWLEK